MILNYCTSCPAWTGTKKVCPTCNNPCEPRAIPKRRADYYFIPESDVPLVAVTKALGVLVKEGLEYWKLKTAVTAALKDPSLSVEEAIASIRGIRDKAGTRGSNVHDIINSLQKKDEGAEYQREIGRRVNAYRQWKKDMPSDTLMTERVVFSLKHGYAGTLDCLIELNGRILVVDFKTSSFLGVEYDWQIAAYRHALKEMGIHTDGGAILQLKEDGTYAWVESNAPIEPFLACLTIYKYLHADKTSKN